MHRTKVRIVEDALDANNTIALEPGVVARLIERLKAGQARDAIKRLQIGRAHV